MRRRPRLGGRGDGKQAEAEVAGAADQPVEGGLVDDVPDDQGGAIGLLRRRPEDLGLLPDGEAVAADTIAPAGPCEHSIATGVALREPRFWLLTLAFAASGFVTVTMTVHLIPYLVAHGHSAAFAATVAGLFGLMSLVGRMTIGSLADRVARRWVTADLIGLQIAGLAILVRSGESALGALVYVALLTRLSIVPSRATKR